uniref:non-specific serine/threonine protein kinase n=1 Tax=Chromera velia CCMP2878 TaxID=1169474 RepID=A0A0K6SB32_9ALVE|eukprot:Cvel_13004.t2-p1 / transcript=Cvel_13004.t2 / gene=Cvel_13004 / organism=Chromera_velia_CCMP2878 / gene_product=Putative ankyrin repeat protein L93, putative / transcript_product=Putative ankyrin repeat protein L93, putative / location=Cvel_scaffold872:29229-35324(-) / protein_length=1260 / sequence_SO=supercontig / SO=protein_coding / is_pseudo=false
MEESQFIRVLSRSQQRACRELRDVVKDRTPEDVKRFLGSIPPDKLRGVLESREGSATLQTAVSRVPPSAEIVKMLVAAGADLRNCDQGGNPILHRALSRRNPDPQIVKALIDAGADVNAMDFGGVPALHRAVKDHRCPVLTKMLLDAGADVKSKDGEFSSTALHVELSRYKPSFEIVKLLVDAGADLEAKDSKGETVIDIARRKKHHDVIFFLLRGECRHQLQRTLGELAVSMYARLDMVRSCASRSNSEEAPCLSLDSEEVEGLWGLPVTPWKEMIGVLQELVQMEGGRDVKLIPPSAVTTRPPSSSRPSTSGSLISSPSSAPAVSSPPSESAPAEPLPCHGLRDRILTVHDLVSLLDERQGALKKVSEVRTRIRSFHTLQRSFRKRVEEANGGGGSREASVGPVTPTEREERDQKRKDVLRVLETAMESCDSAVQGLRCIARAENGGGGGDGLSSMEALAGRLKRALSPLLGIMEEEKGFVLFSTREKNLSSVSFSDLCINALALSSRWIDSRKHAVLEVRAASEKAWEGMGDACSEMRKGNIFAFAAAAVEVEEAEGAEAEVLSRMRRLQDSAECEGFVMIVNFAREVLQRLRGMIDSFHVIQELEDALAEVEREAGYIREGISLSENWGAGEAAVETLGRLIQAEKRLRDKEKRLDLLAQVARMDEENEEVTRLESELQTVREEAKTRDLPSEIARERAHLLTIAARHFPECLWEHSAFLRHVRLNIEEVAHCAPLLQAGVVLKGRSSLRDFSDEKVIAEPSPGTRMTRITDCADRKGGRWVLKRYEIGGGGRGQSQPEAVGACSRWFYRQVAMLHELRHPHLVPVVAAWQEGVYGFIQMPRYPGGNLREWMAARPAEGGRGAGESLRLAEDLLLVLSFLHEKGKVHCDVKPENILLTEGGRAVLGDFDGVKEKDYRHSTVLYVTCQFLAPEVRAGGRVSTAADIFAAGLVLSELLEGGVLEGDPQRAAAFTALSDAMRATDPSARPTAAQVLHSPLFSGEIARTAQCIVCVDISLCERGLQCSQNHFLCAECLNGYVEANARIDPEYSDVRARFKETKCKVACMNPGCPSAPFDPSDVSRLLRSEVYAAWETAKAEVTEQRVRREMEEEVREQLRKALRQEGAERKVREITEEILTLKCPRCRMAFVEFTGCVALNCANCFCRFCAYCLADCGREAHGHVPECRIAIAIGNRLGFRFGMFPDPPPPSTDRTRWNVFLRERQRDRVREVLRQLGEEERNEATRLLQPLLQERGIRL